MTEFHIKFLLQLTVILFEKVLHTQLNLIRTVIELAKKLVFIISHYFTHFTLSLHYLSNCSPLHLN